MLRDEAVEDVEKRFLKAAVDFLEGKHIDLTREKFPSNDNSFTPLQELAVNLFIGHYDLDHYVRWAQQELLAGHDSPHLRIVAGLREGHAENWQHDFELALQELNVTLPEPESLVWRKARELASDVVHGRVDWETASRKFSDFTEALEFPGELNDLAYFEDERWHLDDSERPWVYRRLAQDFLDGETNTSRKNNHSPMDIWGTMRSFFRRIIAEK